MNAVFPSSCVYVSGPNLVTPICRIGSIKERIHPAAMKGIFGSICALTLALPLGANASSNCPSGKACFYVSSSGNDSGKGSESSPWKTLEKALAKAPAGGYILLKRGNVWKIASSGYKIKKKNITIDAYGSGNKPVLSGNYYYYPGAGRWSPYTPAIQIGGFSSSNDQAASGATIRNIEIKESGGECIRAYSGKVTIDNVFCNGAFGQGIHIREYAIDSKVINSVTYNHNFGAYGVKKGSSSLDTARYGKNIDKINQRHGLQGDRRRKKMQCYAMFGSDGSELKACNGDGWGAGNFTRAIRTEFRNNIVHAGWGESLIIGCGGREALVDNVIVADGKVGIYLDGGSGTIVKNSVVMGTGVKDYYRGNTAGQGIGLNREPYCLQTAKKLGRDASGKSVEIFNNVVSGRSVGLFFWAEVSTKYTGVKIYNNAFVNNVHALHFAHGTHENTLIANNMFVNTKGDSQVKGLMKGFGTKKAGFIFKNNFWSHSPEAASSYVAGSGTNSIIGGDLNLKRDSGYFSVKSNKRNDASWVLPGWLTYADARMKSSGADLSRFGVKYEADRFGHTAAAGSHHIGPVIDAALSQSAPGAPVSIRVSKY